MKKLSITLFLSLLLLNSFGQFSFDTCLVAYYPFDGNANDESINNNHGIVNGPTLTNDRFGNEESAYSFDGINDYIMIQDDSTLNPVNITVCAWYKTVSFEGYGNNPIIDKAYTSHMEPYYQYHLGVVGDQYIYQGQARFQTDLSVDTFRVKYFTNDNFWRPGFWYFLCITYDGTNFKTYINGEVNNVVFYQGQITNYGQNLFIAKYGNIDQYTPGVIDDIRIYNRALESSSVKALYEENILSVNLNGEKAEIVVYPVPTNRFLNIKSELNLDKIKLVDISGKTMMEFSNNTKHIDLKDIPGGLYVLLFYADDSKFVQSKKILIQ